MSLVKGLLNAAASTLAGTVTNKTYVEDVFSAYTYTGTGAVQTINNGIDLAGKGGMVWIKNRSIATGHALLDTTRGITRQLDTSSTGVGNTNSDFGSFNSSGFSLAAASNNWINGAYPYASWTFRKAPKFFDVVAYTGTGAPRTISHSLGTTPGMLIIKATNSTGGWFVWHRTLGATTVLQLESTAAASGSGNPGYFNVTDPTDTVFSLGGSGTNLSGVTYVAYLFAHDTSTDGLIQCGSYVGSDTEPKVIDLGWEAQYVMIKPSSPNTGDWRVYDTSRGMPVSGTAALLRPNVSAEEVSNGSVCPTATGFTVLSFGNGGLNGAGQTYIYMAIRKGPMRPPTSGTQVYNAIARTGNGAVTSVTGAGFAPDLAIVRDRDNLGAVSNQHWVWTDRLRGANRQLDSSSLAVEGTNSLMIQSLNQNGITVGTSTDVNASSDAVINYFFKRAPGFMDVVCFKSGSSYVTPNVVAHNLQVAPELVITKARSGAGGWWTFAPILGLGASCKSLRLNTSDAASTNADSYSVTSTSFSTTLIGDINLDHVAYLFASLPGISKVFSYTGNGTSQPIDCGFTAGAKFVLIKSTNFAGDWYVWDTARGIVAANDPHLSLNTTFAEVTTANSIDPSAVGFIVNQNSATNINVSATTYIFLAIA